MPFGTEEEEERNNDMEILAYGNITDGDDTSVLTVFGISSLVDSDKQVCPSLRPRLKDRQECYHRSLEVHI